MSGGRGEGDFFFVILLQVPEEDILHVLEFTLCSVLIEDYFQLGSTSY